MQPERHLEILRAEGDLIAALPADGLDAVVPSLPDWTVERVVRHLGKLHEWVTGALRLTPGQTMEDIGALKGLPKGSACIPAYRESLDVMLAELAERDPAEPKPTFGGPGSVGWWMRRQAQEVSVHRVDAHDALHAAGGAAPTPLAVDGAADGIDEWARFFLATRFVQRFGPLPEHLWGHTIHIHGTDDPAPAAGAEWLLSIHDQGMDVDATHAKCDVALRGSSPDLLLALWRRRPLDSVEVIGDRDLADRLLDTAKF